MVPTGRYDVIVIGAGIVGSSAAYSLVKKGYKVLLLEQFNLPHTRGSSHGQSRNCSHLSMNEAYVRMMVDAFPAWNVLEREVGQNLFVPCGVIDLREEGSAGSKRLAQALSVHQVPHQVLSPSNFRSQFPMFQVQEKTGAVLDPAGGLLKADKAMKAFQDVFQRFGGILIDGCPVTSVVPGNWINVITPKVTFSAKHVVIATGPWVNQLTSGLGLDIPLQAHKATVFYWKSIEGQRDLHHSSRMPCFIDSSQDDGHYHCYGLPSEEYPDLVKVCLHAGPVCDPDSRDKADTSGVEEQAVKEIQRLLPGLEKQPSVREYCIVTKTPDNSPCIDRHPQHPNIIIATGFSGYGFKLAPSIGKAITELVLGQNPSYSMHLFHLNRFKKSRL